MARGGAFNVSALIRQLGLKAVSGEDLRVLETIQPVLPVGDLAGLTPAHVPPSAMFGDFVAGGVGTNATMEIQSLAPGGLFVDWLIVGPSTSFVGWSVTTVTHAAGLPVLASAGQLSNEPIESVVRSGAIAAVGGNSVAADSINGGTFFPAHPWFVPRGSFFSMQSAVANVSVLLNFSVHEVPAAENAP